MNLKREDFRVLETLRVRWAEVDLQQVVFNGHYLMYFDTGVGAYWRHLALPYGPTMADLGGDFVVRKTTVDYMAPARYDDRLAVGVRLARLGHRSMTLQCAVFLGARLLAHGEVVYVHVGPDASSRPIPAALAHTLQAFEQGEPMVNLKVGAWAELQGPAQPLRTQVFVDEQGVDPALERDDADATARHAVAFNRLGRPVGTGRWLDQGGGVARVGRMAVSSSVRGAGVGERLLKALEDDAAGRGCRQVVLHAQLPALAFYLRQGYRPVSERFEEAGLVHQTLVKDLG